MAGQKLRENPEGIRAKLNETGTAIAARLMVMLDTTRHQIKLPTATTDPLYGATMESIADGSYGDVVTRGRVILTSGAAISVGDRLMSSTTGKVVTWTAAGGTNAQVVGMAESAATGADEYVEVELSGPGVISQG